MTLASDRPIIEQPAFNQPALDQPASLAQQRLTLEEYLVYDDGTDTGYELVDGVLNPMSLGTGKHGGVIRYLATQFDQETARLGLNLIAIQGAVGIQSPRGTRWDTCRIPDITVLSLALWDQLQDREAVIRLNEGTPLLVVEVVSPSTTKTDYRSKHSEYAVLDIPEYWIVDLERQVVTICILVDGRYDDVEYQGEMAIASITFPALTLTAMQILEARP